MVTGKAGGGGSGGGGVSVGGGDSAGKAHIETNLVGPAWLKVAQVCLVVAAKQGPSLVAAAFVAVRTQDATEKQVRQRGDQREVAAHGSVLLTCLTCTHLTAHLFLFICVCSCLFLPLPESPILLFSFLHVSSDHLRIRQ